MLISSVGNKKYKKTNNGITIVIQKLDIVHQYSMVITISPYHTMQTSSQCCQHLENPRNSPRTFFSKIFIFIFPRK